MIQIKYGLLALAIAVTLTGLAFAGPEHDHEHKGEEQAGGHEAEMMEMWAKLAVPGEHHAHMAKTVGTWDFKGEFWMAPDSPTMESHGTAVVESILGGRFFQMTADYDMMGQSIHSLGIEGYDNGQQKHIGVWFDTMGTLMATAEGDCSDGGKVTTTYMSFFDPSVGKDKKYKNVVTMVDDNAMTFESYEMDGEGGERKMMVITYTRKK
ncbi:MAG: DUF1579 domain-containing protein [Acidobacteria bacterium]|uniref:DUF1579 domain-containing protein n=1 Tax=Candidatus Polarisedimenticola svalbardensis TaxID=2886004 RepID=A0A8J6Y2V6_9BACT|nr:DUF1579 domain-containing protein [Candidatus Polarisedimenticola svalbardensis]